VWQQQHRAAGAVQRDGDAAWDERDPADSFELVFGLGSCFDVSDRDESDDRASVSEYRRRPTTSTFVTNDCDDPLNVPVQVASSTPSAAWPVSTYVYTPVAPWVALPDATVVPAWLRTTMATVPDASTAVSSL
jgi:hypothetical protein